MQGLWSTWDRARCNSKGTNLQKFPPRQISSVWISSLLYHWLTGCVHAEQRTYTPAARAYRVPVWSPLSARIHTPLHLLVHFCTTYAYERQAKGPKRNKMTCTRLNEGGLGVWHLPQTISSPSCSLWRALSLPPVNGWSVDFLSNKG